MRVFYPRQKREELLELLGQRVPLLREKLPLLRVVLFGSYAKGRQTTASDIDLLDIYAGSWHEDAYALVKRTLNIIPRLEPHVYIRKEYAQVKGTIDPMIRDGVAIVVDSPTYPS